MKELERLNEDYKRASRYNRIEEGEYDALVTDAYISRDDDGFLNLSLELKVITESHNKYLLIYDSVINSTYIFILRRDIRIFGINLEKLSDLPNHLNDFINKKVHIKVDSPNSYTGQIQGRMSICYLIKQKLVLKYENKI